MANSAHFKLADTQVTEFGVGIEDSDGKHFVWIPIGDDVQATLREMVAATRSAMNKVDAKPTRYQPSEKHAAHK